MHDVAFEFTCAETVSANVLPGQGKLPPLSRALGACYEHILVQRSPGYYSVSGTIGCMWRGEIDLNTLRVDGEIFESRKKKLRTQKYPVARGRGLSSDVLLFSLLTRISS